MWGFCTWCVWSSYWSSTELLLWFVNNEPAALIRALCLSMWSGISIRNSYMIYVNPRSKKYDKRTRLHPPHRYRQRSIWLWKCMCGARGSNPLAASEGLLLCGPWPTYRIRTIFIGADLFFFVKNITLLIWFWPHRRYIFELMIILYVLCLWTNACCLYILYIYLHTELQ